MDSTQRIGRVFKNIVVEIECQAGLLLLGYIGACTIRLESNGQVFLIKTKQLQEVDLSLNKISLTEKNWPLRKVSYLLLINRV